MFSRIKNVLLSDKLQKFVFCILVVLLYVNIFHPVFTNYAFYLGEEKDFTKFLLYASDLVLYVFIFLSFAKKYSEAELKSPETHKIKTFIKILAYTLLLIGTVSLYANYNFVPLDLSLRWFLPLIHGILIFVAMTESRSDLQPAFLKSSAVAGSLVTIVALIQIYEQSSVGLLYLGEPRLDPLSSYLSTFFSSGVSILRAYGLSPHPNILGSLLGISAISSLILLFKSTKANFSLFWLGLALITTVGTLATFSRAAVIGLACALILLFCILATKQGRSRNRQKLISYALSYTVGVVTLALIFYPLYESRVGLEGTTSYTERVNQNQLAIRQIVSYPLLGQGPGSNLFHMEQLHNFWIYPWEIQPVHNLILEFGFDYGILFAGILLLIIVIIPSYYLLNTIKKHYTIPLELVFLFSFLGFLLVTSLFDHYYYSTQPTIYIFWLIYGIFYRGVLNAPIYGKDASLRS